MAMCEYGNVNVQTSVANIPSQFHGVWQRLQILKAIQKLWTPTHWHLHDNHSKNFLFTVYVVPELFNVPAIYFLSIHGRLLSMQMSGQVYHSALGVRASFLTVPTKGMIYMSHLQSLSQEDSIVNTIKLCADCFEMELMLQFSLTVYCIFLYMWLLIKLTSCNFVWQLLTELLTCKNMPWASLIMYWKYMWVQWF